MTTGYAVGLAAVIYVGSAWRDGGVPAHVAVTIGLLVLIGLAAWASGRAVRPWRALLAAAAVSLAAAWLVTIYGNDWTVGGWTDVPHTATLVATIAFVPLSMCPLAAAWALRGWTGSSGGTRVGAVVVLAAGGGWLGYLTLPYVVAWGPTLAGILSCWVTLTLVGTRGRRHDAGMAS
jgi:hypothetical protein